MHNKTSLYSSVFDSDYIVVGSLRESLKFLQDRRSGESRYFTRPYTILPNRQILSHDSQLDTSGNGSHQLLQSQDDIWLSKGL